jgi:hypothetical protein
MCSAFTSATALTRRRDDTPPTFSTILRFQLTTGIFKRPIKGMKPCCALRIFMREPLECSQQTAAQVMRPVLRILTKWQGLTR